MSNPSNSSGELSNAHVVWILLLMNGLVLLFIGWGNGVFSISLGKAWDAVVILAACLAIASGLFTQSSSGDGLQDSSTRARYYNQGSSVAASLQRLHTEASTVGFKDYPYSYYSTGNAFSTSSSTPNHSDYYTSRYGSYPSSLHAPESDGVLPEEAIRKPAGAKKVHRVRWMKGEGEGEGEGGGGRGGYLRKAVSCINGDERKLGRRRSSHRRSENCEVDDMSNVDDAADAFIAQFRRKLRLEKHTEMASRAAAN